MISAGNDIVSLAAIDVTRTNQYKFYSKILSEAEIPLYNEFSLAQIPFEIFVWLLWTIKESAYKFLQRHKPGLLFTPVRFVVTDLLLPADHSICTFNSSNLGGISFRETSRIHSTLKFGDELLYACSIVHKEFIHTVSNSGEDFENMLWGVKKIDTDDGDVQSAEARLFLLERANKVYGDSFRVEKNESGCPVLLSEGSDALIPVSLSHHGRFVGYSLVRPGSS